MLSGVKHRNRPAGSGTPIRCAEGSGASIERRQALCGEPQVRRLVSLGEPQIDGLQQVSGVRGLTLAGLQPRKSQTSATGRASISTIDLNRTIAGSRDGSDVCAASRSMARPTGSADSTMNFVTSSAADPATTNTFQPLADAVAFSTTPELRSASADCMISASNQHAAPQTARDVTEPQGWIDIVGRRNLPDTRARLMRRRDDAQLVLDTPSPATLPPRDDLDHPV